MSALIQFGAKMVRDPAQLKLAYYDPFKPRGNRKALPISLENDDEWRSLIRNVKHHEKEVKEKKGKGKPYVFELVDMTEKSEPKVSQCSAAH